MSLSYPKGSNKSFVAPAHLGEIGAVGIGSGGPVNFYSASVALLWTTAMRFAARPQDIPSCRQPAAASLPCVHRLRCDGYQHQAVGWNLKIERAAIEESHDGRREFGGSA